MKKFAIVLLVFILVGCTNTKPVDEVSIKELQDEIVTLKAKIKNLELNNIVYGDAVTFKDFITLRLKVINKIEGDDTSPHFIIVSDLDVDHNTPLILPIEDVKIFQDIKMDATYDMKLYIISVIEKEENKARFEFILTEYVKVD